MATTKTYFYGWTEAQIIKLLENVSESDLPKAPKKHVLESWDRTKVENTKEEKIYRQLLSLQYQKYMIINDPIHGTIELHPLLVEITKTPAFDRLKYVKQLGGGYYVFPGATHTRFEHSVGTCYIAGEFVRMLQRKQPELEITDKEVLCVEIAGLCHDLGHGPYSHMFESACNSEFEDFGLGTKVFKHEDISKKVLWYIYKELKKEFTSYGFVECDMKIIQTMIEPKEKPAERTFLYEIVANKGTGIDVDKWDYFARDCHYLGLACDFDWRRLMSLSRVIKTEDGCYHICFRDKAMKNVYGMFRTRCVLHQTAYQHKKIKAVEIMLSRAIAMAKDEKKIDFKSAKALEEKCGTSKLTVEQLFHDVKSVKQIVEECIEFVATDDADPKAVKQFLSLTDSVTQDIINPEAKKLVDDIANRHIYQQMFAKKLELSFVHSLQKKEGKTWVRTRQRDWKEKLEKQGSGEVFVKIVTISHGSEKKGVYADPVDYVYFYKKDRPWEAKLGKAFMKLKSDVTLPRAFVEVEAQVYYPIDDKTEKTHGKIEEDFEKIVEKEVQAMHFYCLWGPCLCI